MRQHLFGVALAAEQQQPDLALVQPQMKNGIVEFARQPQEIGVGTLRDEGVHVRRRVLARTVNGDRRRAKAAVNRNLDGAVAD